MLPAAAAAQIHVPDRKHHGNEEGETAAGAGTGAGGADAAAAPAAAAAWWLKQEALIAWRDPLAVGRGRRIFKYILYTCIIQSPVYMKHLPNCPSHI